MIPHTVLFIGQSLCCKDGSDNNYKLQYLDDDNPNLSFSVVLIIMRVIVVTKSEDVPLAAVDGKLTLVYWNITGLVQPIRLVLAQAGADAVDVRIEGGDAAHADYKQDWMKAKDPSRSKGKK